MTPQLWLVLLAGVFTGASAAVPANVQTEARTNLNAEARMINAQGKELGVVALRDTLHGVLLQVMLQGLPAGGHAIHLHERGQCDASTQFESAGDHFNPDARAHGLFRADGPHAGDMPNQSVGQDGRLLVNLFNSRITLRSGAASLFDADGSAIVIHSGVDDYTSQPSGSAGTPIACGVIRRL